MSETTVTLHLTLAELAMINHALDVRHALATFPKCKADILNEQDADTCNRLEKETFALYCTYAAGADTESSLFLSERR